MLSAMKTLLLTCAALLGAAMCLGTPGLIAALCALAVYLLAVLLGGVFGARALFDALRAFGESGDAASLTAHGPAAAMLLEMLAGFAVGAAAGAVCANLRPRARRRGKTAKV